jgi:uncharacterized phage infection (PIP) family protein YhgE|tara:strand:+ start:91 stop:399 length:309 start_codon:yes stop_codon:yes gene_type:complete
VNKDQFKILSETLEGISSNPYSEVSEEVITEADIDAEKLEILNGMEKMLSQIDQGSFRLSTLDRIDSSGAYDLNDQLTTLDEVIEKLYAVIRRAKQIVPTND